MEVAIVLARGFAQALSAQARDTLAGFGEIAGAILPAASRAASPSSRRRTASACRKVSIE